VRLVGYEKENCSFLYIRILEHKGDILY